MWQNTYDDPDWLREPGQSIDEYLKASRKEEKEERKFTFFKESTIKLLQILETIANEIVTKPKRAVALLIFIPVMINVLTSAINFLGYQAWTNYIVPLFNGLVAAVR